MGVPKAALKRRKHMKVELLTSYTSEAAHLAEVERLIAEIEDKLKTPARTVEDIVLHMQLLKERNSLL